MLLLIVVTWALMTLGLAVLPGLLDGLLPEPWPIVAAWAIVSLVWVPLEALMRERTGALARFSISLLLWIAAAAGGFWLKETLGLG